MLLDAKLQQYRDLWPGTKFPLPTEDAEGFSTWQLWALMADFGEHIAMGLEVPFETSIQIVLPRDTDGSPKRTDAKRQDGEAATAGAEGIAPQASGKEA
jgi:hypothetical protein